MASITLFAAHFQIALCNLMIPPTAPASVAVPYPVSFLVNGKLLKVVAIVEGMFMVITVRAVRS